MQQGHIGRELGRLKVEWCDPPGAACTAKRGGAFVIEIVEGGSGVAEQILLAMAGKDLDGIHLQLGAFECDVMVEDQEVSRRESLNRLGIPDHDAVANAKSDGLERLEWKRQPWTGRVVRSQDGTGRRDVTDQESEAGDGHGWRDGPFGERLAAQGRGSRAVRRRGRRQGCPGQCGGLCF